MNLSFKKKKTLREGRCFISLFTKNYHMERTHFFWSHLPSCIFLFYFILNDTHFKDEKTADPDRQRRISYETRATSAAEIKVREAVNLCLVHLYLKKKMFKNKIRTNFKNNEWCVHSFLVFSIFLEILLRENFKRRPSASCSAFSNWIQIETVNEWCGACTSCLFFF